jgi:hypothetical protein
MPAAVPPVQDIVTHVQPTGESITGASRLEIVSDVALDRDVFGRPGKSDSISGNADSKSLCNGGTKIGLRSEEIGEPV